MARRDLKPNEQDVYELLLSNINNLKLFDNVPDRTIQLIIDGVDDLVDAIIENESEEYNDWQF